jgi:hypothetical protein
MLRTLLPLSLLALLTGCPDDQLRPALPPDVVVDSWAQQAAAKVDVLWVVDNSQSMAEEQENLARNFQSFIELFTRGAIDYRIAVTTTDVFADAGQFKGTPKILTPQTGNVVAAFGKNIKVGTGGSSNEQGLEAARMAIDRQKQANAPRHKEIEDCRFACKDAACLQGCYDKFPVDFLRPDAFLYLIFVSDEEDFSPGDLRYYWRSFETASGIGNDGTVTVAAIVGTQATNTCSANPGERYLALATQSGGESGDICDTNFSVTLRKLASNAVGLKRKFALTRKPNPETLKVEVRYPCNADAETVKPCASHDRAACAGEAADHVAWSCVPTQGGADGWRYEPATNVIFFAGDSVPGLKAELDIQYYPEGKGP